MFPVLDIARRSFLHRYTIPYALSTTPDKTVRVHPQLERSNLLSLLGPSLTGSV